MSGDDQVWLAQLRRLVREELARQRVAELGIVQDVHPRDPDGSPGNYAVTVRMRDTDLVLPQVPVATGRLGAVALPPIGAVVLVQFIAGDINAPIVTGSLYDNENRSPVHAADEVVVNLPHDADPNDAVRLVVRSTSDRHVELTIADKVKVLVSDTDPAVQIDVAGQATLQIDSDGRTSIKTGAAIELRSGGDFNLRSDGNLVIEAGGKLALKGSVIDLN